MKARVAVLGVLGLLAEPGVARAQDAKVIPEFVGVWDKAPDLACSRAVGVTQSDYGLALAVLYSLSYGKDANDRSTEIAPAVAGSANLGTLMTELLRISKEQSSDFACAEVPLASFNQRSIDTMTRMFAQNMLFTWHQQIDLNDRLNSFTKTMGQMSDVDMADKMSTLQVDRGNLWKSFGPLVNFVLLKLVDDKRISPANTLPYLTINKAQKAELISKIKYYFPKVETQEVKDMDQATFYASLYLYFLNGRKASDEV